MGPYFLRTRLYVSSVVFNFRHIYSYDTALVSQDYMLQSCSIMYKSSKAELEHFECGCVKHYL